VYNTKEFREFIMRGMGDLRSAIIAPSEIVSPVSDVMPPVGMPLNGVDFNLFVSPLDNSMPRWLTPWPWAPTINYVLVNSSSTSRVALAPC
jgi:large-conductance mechanosensitive channel